MRYLIALLLSVQAFGQVSLSDPGFIASLAPAAAAGVAGTAWTTSNPGSGPRSSLSGCVGRHIVVGGAQITVSGLRIWKISGNNDSVTVTITADSDGAPALTSAVFDMTMLSDGWNEVAVTPINLSASTTYRLFRTVTSGQDEWNDEWNPTVTGVAADSVSIYSLDCSGFLNWTSASFAGVDFKYTAP